MTLIKPLVITVILVKKKARTFRFCVDYRRLNKIARNDAYLLTRIDATLDSILGASFFSSLDMRSGYWQIPVPEKIKAKTAFGTPDGLYEFNLNAFWLM